MLASHSSLAQTTPFEPLLIPHSFLPLTLMTDSSISRLRSGFWWYGDTPPPAPGEPLYEVRAAPPSAGAEASYCSGASRPPAAPGEPP